MGLGDELKFKYEPILEEVPLDMTFHYYEKDEEGQDVLKIHTDNYKLISSIEELKEFAKESKDKWIAFDTETTGLTYGEDKIVGFSLALNSNSGIYVPIRHKIKQVEITRVDKVDENGNPVLTKTGKIATQRKEIVTLFDCPENLDPKEALDVLYEILINAKQVLIHNSIFDLNMLKFEGYDVTKIKSFDTLILPYIFDPEAMGFAGLKALERRLLGRAVPEFKDVLGKGNENFALVKPSDGYMYACLDVSGLYGIYEVLCPKVKELLAKFRDQLILDGKPYNIMKKDNALVQAFVDYYGHAKILIDKEKAIIYKKQLEDRQREVMKQIYQYFDMGMFDLSPSSNEFKRILMAKKVFTGETTKKGQPSWATPATVEMSKNIAKLGEFLNKKDSFVLIGGKLNKSFSGAELAKIILKFGDGYFKINETKNELSLKGPKGEPMDKALFWATLEKMYKDEIEKFNILKLVQENNSLNKALNSYVTKLTEVDECFMNYRLKGTKSGRLSSGNGSKSDKSKNNYYIDLNAQNLTKPASAYYVAEECGSKDPQNILGWKFTPVEKSYAMEHLEDLYIVEGQDPNVTIRGCLKAPEGKISYSHVVDPEGSEDMEAFKVVLSNKVEVPCCDDTIFKVMHRGINTFMTLESIKRCEEVYIYLKDGSTEKVESIEPIGLNKARLLGREKVLVKGCVPVYSGGKIGSRYVVSLDYDAEEYLVACILSGDSFSKEMFLKGIDPHTATAYAIWGEENYDKAKRKKAKIFNFANMYGGGAPTIARSLDIPVEEAQKMVDSYEQKLHETIEWKRREVEKMYNNGGVVFNAFGRPRQFMGWLNLIEKNNDRIFNGQYSNLIEREGIIKSSNKVKAAIERRVSSHAIQGTCGDILRYDLLKLYKKYFKDRDPHIDFLSTVHDEINYTIDKEYTTQYVKELEEIMTFTELNDLNKILPIRTSTDIGFTYGNMFPFVWEDDTKKKLIPKRVHHA